MWNEQANTVFLQARELPSGPAREAFIEEACGGAPSIWFEVTSLLDAEDEAGDFLESPVSGLTATAALSATFERSGTVIGPYTLVEQIGEGGMGVVFMAEQTVPVQRTVALKIIKPGMDSRQVIARFEAERQALALMDHPNIAKVLDAGTTDTGRPYFVMELVKGIPITKYCDGKQLSVRERLLLFLSVCHAVQHAHQKGIIHRDLKPSNVLVAEYDDEPVPKVIDFGVVKATAQKLTKRTMFTEFGQLIGTFEYMSPEQARFNHVDVDTRSDIYSLGVMLYELLTGSTPFGKQRLETTPFDETLRIIREEEPPQPSARLTQSRELSTIAVRRQAEPARLTGLVRGELDWIVMKALEKDRERRYETTAALADDLMHVLADEPVSAGPPSRLYRAGKFVRRNRGPVVAASLVALAIVGGIAASTWQAIRATRAEHQAVASAALARESALAERAAKEAEAKQRKQAESFSNFLMSAFSAEYPERDIQTLTEVLKHSEQELQTAYSDDPTGRAIYLATIGRAHAGLRRFEEAEKTYRNCLEVASEPGLIDRVRHELAACLLRQGKLREATPLLQELYLDSLKHAGSSEAEQLLAIWPTLPDASAAGEGTPGMDGLELNGNGDYVILPRLFFDGRPAWTLEAIVWPAEIATSNPKSGSPAGWTSLISTADAGGISLESSRQRWAVELYAAGIPGAEWVDNYASAVARTEAPLRRWQHVAGVWDGKELRLYVDGELQNTRRGVDYCTQLSLAPMFLGADPANPTYSRQVAEGFFHGRLRAVRISRAAQYTESFSPPTKLETSPDAIGLYDFTIDQGNYAIDRSGNGNHGLVIGAKYVGAMND